MRQLMGSNVALYLQRCAPISPDTGRKACSFNDAMVSITGDDYAKLESEAEAWVRQFRTTGADGEGEGSTKVNVPVGTQLHLISANDTIQGLAIRYDTTVAKIRLLNGLPGQRSIYERRELLVPATGSTENSNAVSTFPNPTVEEFRELAQYYLAADFANTHKVPVEEARIYLDMNDYDIAKATMELQQDGDWANNGNLSANGEAVPLTLKDFLARTSSNSIDSNTTTKQSLTI